MGDSSLESQVELTENWTNPRVNSADQNMATVDRTAHVPFLVPTYYNLNGDFVRLINYETRRDKDKLKRFDLHMYRDSTVNEILTRFLEHLDEEDTKEPGTLFKVSTIYACMRRQNFERKLISRIEVGMDKDNNSALKRRPFGKPYRPGEMVEIAVKFPRGVLKRRSGEKEKAAEESSEKKSKPSSEGITDAKKEAEPTAEAPEQQSAELDMVLGGQDSVDADLMKDYGAEDGGGDTDNDLLEQGQEEPTPEEEKTEAPAEDAMAPAE